MKSLFILFTISFFFFYQSYSQEAKIDKAEYYKVISSEDVNLIDDQITKLKTLSCPEKDAYCGTLLMIKADLVKFPTQKLSLFKEGHQLLEMAISKDENNVEYRFLRLLIQENAPGFLGYNKNLKDDSILITKNISSLSEEVRKAINDYVKKKKSKALKTND